MENNEMNRPTHVAIVALGAGRGAAITDCCDMCVMYGVAGIKVPDVASLSDLRLSLPVAIGKRRHVVHRIRSFLRLCPIPSEPGSTGLNLLLYIAVAYSFGALVQHLI